MFNLPVHRPSGRKPIERTVIERTFTDDIQNDLCESVQPAKICVLLWEHCKDRVKSISSAESVAQNQCDALVFGELPVFNEDHPSLFR